jgi:hypothetical protein
MKIRYECPLCSRRVTLNIAPSAPPECACRKGKVTTTMRPVADEIRKETKV